MVQLEDLADVNSSDRHIESLDPVPRIEAGFSRAAGGK